MEKFDWIVIGGGSGGLSVLEMALEFDKKCLLVDPNPLGGTCVNVGCVPKKMMWNLAEIYEKSRILKDYKIKKDEKEKREKFSFSDFVKEREKIIKKINNWYEKEIASKITYVKGKAFFKEPHIIQVEKKKFFGEKIVISTGSKPIFPREIEGSELGITSEGFFELKEIPKSACIVGSGYIALELASIMNSLQEIKYGKRNVTILVRSKRILRKTDEESTGFLLKQLKEKGINFIFNQTIKKIKKKKKNLLIELQSTKKIEKEVLIWAIGREPNIEELSLEKTKISLDKGKHIKINDFFETKQPNHYALGDVIDKPKLTPVAIQCGRRLIRQIYENKEKNRVSFDFVPTVVFTHPPLATIGVSQEEAEEKKIEIEIFKNRFFPMIYNFSSSAPETFIKMICEKETQRVIGLHMVGDCADEILQGFSVAISMGATKKQLDKSFALHPTSAEEIITLKPLV